MRVMTCRACAADMLPGEETCSRCGWKAPVSQPGTSQADPIAPHLADEMESAVVAEATEFLPPLRDKAGPTSTSELPPSAPASTRVRARRDSDMATSNNNRNTSTSKRAAATSTASKRASKSTAAAAKPAAAKRTSKATAEPVADVVELAAKRTSKRAAKAVAVTAPTDSPRSMRPKFETHVHPETYVASDALDVRQHQLHTKWSECESSMCTWADQTDDARSHDVELAKSLRVELREAAKAERSSITPSDRESLVDLCARAQAATEAFELFVATLIENGASPSHVGDAIGMGNSAVRRIAWRANPELKPEGY